MLWLFPWGLLAGCALLLALIVAGLSARFSWLAALCVAALAVGSAAVVLALTAAHSNFSYAQLWFFVPALVSASVGIWLAVTDGPRGGRQAAAVKLDPPFATEESAWP